jgi:hypothetical protein
MVSIPAEPVDGKVIVQRGGAVKAKPLHDSETRPIDDREVLIGKRVADRECHGEIGRRYEFERRRAVLDRFPVLLRSVAAEPACEE